VFINHKLCSHTETRMRYEAQHPWWTFQKSSSHDLSVCDSQTNK